MNFSTWRTELSISEFQASRLIYLARSGVVDDVCEYAESIGLDFSTVGETLCVGPCSNGGPLALNPSMSTMDELTIASVVDAIRSKNPKRISCEFRRWLSGDEAKAIEGMTAVEAERELSVLRGVVNA
jgi:hypothetical protein